MHAAPAGFGTTGPGALTAAPGVEGWEPGIFLFGTGQYGASSPYLAFLPTSGCAGGPAKCEFWTGLDAKGNSATWYFMGLNGKQQPTWTQNEWQAVPVFYDNPAGQGRLSPSNDPGTVGHGSVIYSPQLALWVYLYDGGKVLQGGTHYGGLYVAYAQAPWGPWTQAPAGGSFQRNPGRMFIDCDDGGFGNFILYVTQDPAGGDCPQALANGINSGVYVDNGSDPDTQAGTYYYARPPGPSTGSSQASDPFGPVAYETRGVSFAPEAIERCTEINSNTLTIYYNNSTWNPYAVVKMKQNLTIQVAAPAITAPVAGFSTANHSITVNGNAANPNGAVTILDGTTQVGTATADPGGNFTVSVTLPSGAHSLAVTQTVAGLKSAASAAVAITVLTAITVQTVPAGLPFSVDGGPAQTAPSTVNLTVGSHTLAVAATQAGGSGTQYIFASWNDGGAAAHNITVGGAAATYTAAFTVQYLLTTAVSPAAAGVVTPSPASSGYYNAGASVQLTASANPGFAFNSWSGDLTGIADPQSITMTAPHSVTANFSGADCSFVLIPALASLLANGTSTVEPCPDHAQPNCGVSPETPRTFTVTPGAACGAWTATSSNPGILQITAGASTVTYTALTNTHTLPQSYSITVASAAGSANYTIAEAGSGGSQVYREVYALYEQLLGRDPDPAGFAFWTGSGGAGLGQMADSFLTSPEPFNSDCAVMAAYQAATGAPPTYAQYTAAVNQRAGGDADRACPVQLAHPSRLHGDQLIPEPLEPLAGSLGYGLQRRGTRSVLPGPHRVPIEHHAGGRPQQRISEHGRLSHQTTPTACTCGCCTTRCWAATPTRRA